MATYKILIFSWDTATLPLGESLDEAVLKEHRPGGWVSYLLQGAWPSRYVIADFFGKLKEKIQGRDVVVIGFQEDRKPGSYFHSHLLTTEMEGMGFGLVKRTRLMRLVEDRPVTEETQGIFTSGIRVSIYARKRLVGLIAETEKPLREVMSDDGQLSGDCTVAGQRSGATASYLMLPGMGQLVFICAYFPQDLEKAQLARRSGDEFLRQNQLNLTNHCFNNYIREFVTSRYPIPTHVVYFGTFNYRIWDVRPIATIVKDLYKPKADLERFWEKSDELRDQIKRRNVYSLREGVSDHGPTFLPTCNLSEHQCQDPAKYKACWDVGEDEDIVPAWCERILYGRFGTPDGYELVCTGYDRFDEGETMKKSDHAGVLGYFTLGPFTKR